MAKNKETLKPKGKAKSSMHETELSKKPNMHSTPEMNNSHSTQSKPKNRK